MNPYFNLLLAVHSSLRWVVVVLFIYLTIRWYRNNKRNGNFEKGDKYLINTFLISYLIQIIIGIELYFSSPLANYFLTHISTAIHDRQPRFFGLEHISMMILGFVLLLVGVYKSKKNQRPFRILFIYFILAFLVVFFSIPWSFSPLISRPLYRLY